MRGAGDSTTSHVRANRSRSIRKQTPWGFAPTALFGSGWWLRSSDSFQRVYGHFLCTSLIFLPRSYSSLVVVISQAENPCDESEGFFRLTTVYGTRTIKAVLLRLLCYGRF